LLAKNHNKELTRDYLYKVINDHHIKVYDKQLDEKLESAYIALFKFDPSMKPFIQ